MWHQTLASLAAWVLILAGLAVSLALAWYGRSDR